jgi:hypothetical protein
MLNKVYDENNPRPALRRIIKAEEYFFAVYVVAGMVDDILRIEMSAAFACSRPLKSKYGGLVPPPLHLQ